MGTILLEFERKIDQARCKSFSSCQGIWRVGREKPNISSEEFRNVGLSSNRSKSASNCMEGRVSTSKNVRELRVSEKASPGVRSVSKRKSNMEKRGNVKFLSSKELRKKMGQLISVTLSCCTRGGL